MKYVNEQTGAVVDVTSKLGGAWRPLEETARSLVVEETKTEATKRKRKTTTKE